GRTDAVEVSTGIARDAAGIGDELVTRRGRRRNWEERKERPIRRNGHRGPIDRKLGVTVAYRAEDEVGIADGDDLIPFREDDPRVERAFHEGDRRQGGGGQCRARLRGGL